MTSRIPDPDPRRDPPTQPYPEQHPNSPTEPYPEQHPDPPTERYPEQHRHPRAAEHDLWTDGQGAGANEQSDGGQPEMCVIPDSAGGEPSGAYRAPFDVPRSKAADRAAVRAFRPQRRVPAVVVALLLTLLGLLVAVETLSGLFGRPLRWIPYEGVLSWAASTLWSDPLMLLASAVVTLLGLALLVTALVPGRPSMVPVRSGDPDVIIGLRPKSVTRALAHAAEQVPGVHSARAVRHGHTFEVRPTTYGRDTDEFGQEVRGAVLTRLAALDLVEPYRVTVHVKERRRG
ncbi:DUF6286 domain-containing protein [Nonomuraea fuscirosea]|uniref:DUF6286 domain-containing protein n=1 Tax=Nonomuraea fuscirosea TaxID=1291556 RepID=UPI00342ACF48